MIRKLSPAEAKEVSATIHAAEAGKATLMQLARAHHIAETAGAKETLGILRGHIRAMTPEPIQNSLDLKNIVLGVFTGILTWAILESATK